MKIVDSCLPLLLTVGLFVPALSAQEELSLDENMCVLCHGNEDIWDDDTKHLFVTAEALANDIHWQKGIRCQDCHGGNAESTNLREAHAIDDGFRDIVTPADMPAFCGHCHSNAEYMQKFAPDSKTDIVDRFWESVHGRYLKQLAAETPEAAQPGVGDVAEAAEAPKVANCTSCHATHNMRAVSDPLSLAHPSQLTTTCGACHQQQRDALLADVHSQAGEKDAQGRGTVLGCAECHGDDVHGMLPVDDRASPAFLNNQVERCGQCHEKDTLTYLSSVHGKGLVDSGLLVTAVCADCHGAHGILPAENEDSLLHATNVAATCATCHRFIEERLRTSVHGGGTGPGGVSEHAAPGGDILRKPSCTDCHQNHDIADPRAPASRQAMTDRCGDCHQDLLRQYDISIHGALTRLGYGPAAKCADCHGDHEIRRLSDPESRLSPANRAETCGKCHPGASGNFLDFDPHADHRDPERSPVLYAVYMVLMTFLLGTIGVFGVHSILWFIRGMVDVVRHGREHSWKPGAVAYLRFRPFHRASHTLLMVSFLGLALTGLPLKYSHTAWAQATAIAMGGFASTSVWHRIFGVVNIGCLGVYLVLMSVRVVLAQRRGVPLKQSIFGPDSPVPNWRDVKDFISMFRWFFGVGKKPTFERWAYWEKVDFWGASADIVIIGMTGLILWFPAAVCAFLPGETLNIAKVIHSTQALLATGFVFAIHFFATHLRPEKFPMDMVMLTGMVSEEELQEERPEMLAERLAAAGVGLEVSVFPAAQLGSEAELLEQLVAGELELAIAGPSFLAMWYAEIGAFDAAYVFRDLDHMLDVAHGELIQPLWDELLKRYGVRVLDTWVYGSRHITSNKPIRHPDDLRGFRLRLPAARVWQASGEALGASPMPVAFAEVYMALQQGMADGQENPVPTIQAMGFHEVQKYLNLTGHIQSSIQILVNERVWQRLTAEQQMPCSGRSANWAWKVREGTLRDEREILNRWREKACCKSSTMWTWTLSAAGPGNTSPPGSLSAGCIRQSARKEASPPETPAGGADSQRAAAQAEDVP
jgi:tripartite ATP-independent transporter DctP family solute receptor